MPTTSAIYAPLVQEYFRAAVSVAGVGGKCEARPAARAALMLRLNIYFQPANEKKERVSTRDMT
ncbi:hypothetical protein JL978_19190 [Acinetobacter baumannii]|uniref:hypothetical protein n=1 Tax=Acinetobacter baumannii TaxID=470 RepID=UPI001C449C6A|nr:hypothetical protein [Acinetobacter baumannii]MBV6579035.1 hypothetical protein [Acinetobacter baumannii]